MHPEKLAALVRRLEHVVSLMHGPQYDNAIVTHHAKRILHGGQILHFLPEAWTDVEDMTKKLRDEPWGSFFADRSFKENVSAGRGSLR